MTDWQPIETAPKDGTPILGAPRANAYIVEGTTIAWHNGAWCGDFGVEGWVPLRGPFTHWKPFPALTPDDGEVG